MSPRASRRVPQSCCQSVRSPIRSCALNLVRENDARIVLCADVRSPASSKTYGMAYIGQHLENPVTGERLTFVETAASTGGERVVVDLELEAGGKVPGVHIHPKQEEKFEVLQGTMKFRYGMKNIVAQA